MVVVIGSQRPGYGNAGSLDRRVTLQRVSYTSSPSGEPEESWASLATNRAASVQPVHGDEVLGGEQARARQQVEFHVRWSRDIADLSPLDRVVYPAGAATDSPSQTSSVYDILAVHELGRHDMLRVVAARRPDVR
jgi:head-tail adaptor